MMVQHMIHRLQNGGVIRMGPFAALNYETASNVIKLKESDATKLFKMSEIQSYFSS